jgi:nanoRNase/pAp phosphatase (c-di-AMP/oligoRNAs hydrolase)
MEEADKIKSAVEAAKNIALFVGAEPNADAIGAALAVFFALKNIGKRPFFVNAEPLKEINALIQKFNKEKLVLTFQGDASEISYEKTGNQTLIYLTPKAGAVPAESFSCKTAASQEDLAEANETAFDLLITLGIDEYSKIEDAFASNLDALYQCDIINIDNNLGNQNYGDINVVSDNPCLSQTIACLFFELGSSYMNKKSGDALIYGLINSPKNSRSSKNFKTFRWLLKNNAGFDLLSNKGNPNSHSKIKLLEKVLNNIDAAVRKNFGVVFSALSAEELLKIKANPKDFIFVVEKVKNFFSIPSFVLLWEDSNKFNCLFYTNSTSILKNLKSTFPGEYKETGGLFIASAPALKDAKTKIIEQLP